MYIKLINCTNTANIYGLYNDENRIIGTCEMVLAGREAGKSFYASWSHHTNREIKKLFRKYA